MATTLTTPPIFVVSKVPVDVDGRITHLWGEPELHGVVVSSTVRINLPENLKISDPSTHEHCPELLSKRVSAIGPDLNGEYLLVDGSFTVELKADNCVRYRTFTESSTGPVGSKGEKGNSGTGTSGDKGEQGEKGEKGVGGDTGPTGASGTGGSKGQPGSQGEAGEKGGEGGSGSSGSKGSQGSSGEAGSKGEQGSPGNSGETGDAGAAGSKGSKGEGLDWNDTQQSILIGGTKFGPRLIGVCQNGTYKYVYVFASDPTS